MAVALVLATDVMSTTRVSGLWRSMGGSRGGILPGLRQLELTDTQREQIREISGQNQADGRDLA